jgi:hypothetical protein
MKCFDQVAPWPNKVNYVDTNNVVLGFDTQRNGCEDFGHGLASSLLEAKDITTYRVDPCPFDITDYSFAQEAPASLGGEASDTNAMAFRILSPNKPELFVVIWNHHNGYYAHGFTFEGPGVVAVSDSL